MRDSAVYFMEQDTSIFQEAQKRFVKAKESVKSYLKQDLEEEQLPHPIELKIIQETTSMEEQQLRAMKEQQQIKNDLKLREEKRKAELAKKEKRAAKDVKGAITYDFEGNVISIKPPNANKLGGVNFMVGVNIPSQAMRELNDPNVVAIPRAKNIEDPFK